MADIEQQERIEVFVGVDVGKGTHHAVALDLTGKRLLDSALPNDEAKLRGFEHSSPSSKNMVACCSSSISRRRSALCQLRWLELVDLSQHSLHRESQAFRDPDIIRGDLTTQLGHAAAVQQRDDAELPAQAAQCVDPIGAG